MHDRHPAHTNRDLESFVSSNLFTAELLPATAPDLSHLYYGMFPFHKGTWRRQAQQGRLSWPIQCSLLTELLCNAKVDAFIAALPSRVQNRIASGGNHFD